MAAPQSQDGAALLEDKIRALVLGNGQGAANQPVPKNQPSKQRGRRYKPFNQLDQATQPQNGNGQEPRSNGTINGPHSTVQSQDWRRNDNPRMVFTRDLPPGPTNGNYQPNGRQGSVQAPNGQQQRVNVAQREVPRGPAYPLNAQTPGPGSKNRQQPQVNNIQRGARAPIHSVNAQALGHGPDNRQHSRPSQYVPVTRQPRAQMNDVLGQSNFLEHILNQELSNMMMSPEEYAMKDAFRLHIENACQQAVRAISPNLANFQLVSFGSLSSGFGMPGSDMDLALVSRVPATPEMPRMLEKAILDQNFGARLLTRTRVPIIKVCEKPLPELHEALFAERQKWDDMTPEERQDYDSGNQKDEQPVVEEKNDATERAEVTENDTGALKGASKPQERRRSEVKDASDATLGNQPPETQDQAVTDSIPPTNVEDKPVHQQQQNRRPQRAWLRERKLGPLDFPKSGVGIQCDINFSNPLGLHNTKMLRCYSLCDPRVRPMVLFVKAWASRRKINSSYNGTLSSYGYVLMVLHFLVNVASPPVCPNLQLVRRPPHLAQGRAVDPNFVCEGYDVYFWQAEAEIQNLAARHMLTTNREPLGVLLRQFFLYYAQQGYHAPFGGFAWTQEVLSLRTPGGLLTKQTKGWTGAKTTLVDNKEVRQRYLFAIEDPFELDHNVARTVTHNGIVAIRDEFRRAWRILQAVGRGQKPEGELFEVLVDELPVEEAGVQAPVVTTEGQHVERPITMGGITMG